MNAAGINFKKIRHEPIIQKNGVKQEVNAIVQNIVQDIVQENKDIKISSKIDKSDYNDNENI